MASQLEATSSILQLDPKESTIMVLHAAAALAVATSPSGFANLCAPVGATIIGDGILYPNKVVDMSILLTSIRTLGRNLWDPR
jgi:hypothetical protein